MSYLIPTWPAPISVKALMTTRLSGYSEGPYAHFNLAENVGDNTDHIALNYQKLQQETHLPNTPIWLKQAHGNRVVMADEITEEKPEADSSISRKKEVVCVVSTADCLPILLCDSAGHEVAAVHAGWKGLSTGIIKTTLQAMLTPKAQLLVWLGPAISATVYEVGEDVRGQFPNNPNAFTIKENGKWLMDLYSIARYQLQQQGIEQIYGGDFCTYTDSKRFFSYRRDGAKTGRMASLIWLT